MSDNDEAYYDSLSDVYDEEYLYKSDSEESGEEGGSDKEEGGTDNEALCCKTLGCTRQMSCRYASDYSHAGCFMCHIDCKCDYYDRIYSSQSESWRMALDGKRWFSLQQLQQLIHTKFESPGERMFFVLIFLGRERIEVNNPLDLDYANPTDAQLMEYNSVVR